VLEAKIQGFDCDLQETQAKAYEEKLKITGKWIVPEDLPGWAEKTLAWRPVIRLEYFEGERQMAGEQTKGSRRLEMTFYAQIGHRNSKREQPSPVYIAGPICKSDYQPIGNGKVVPSPINKFPSEVDRAQERFYRDLESLNSEYIPWEATVKKGPDIPSIEWTHKSKFKKPLEEMQKLLDGIIKS